MPQINARQRERDRNGLRHKCAACGHKETGANPLVVDDDGFRVHRSHVTDRSDPMYVPGR